MTEIRGAIYQGRELLTVVETDSAEFALHDHAERYGRDPYGLLFVEVSADLYAALFKDQEAAMDAIEAACKAQLKADGLW